MRIPVLLFDVVALTDAARGSGDNIAPVEEVVIP